jgi:hypothetical protein
VIHAEKVEITRSRRIAVFATWQQGAEVWRRTETGEAPRRQGATTENAGSI